MALLRRRVALLLVQESSHLAGGHGSLRDVWEGRDNNGWETLTSGHSGHGHQSLDLEDKESGEECREGH